MTRWLPSVATLAAVLLTTTSRVSSIEAPPAPESVLGAPACADHTLATSEQIATYFRALDRASDRVHLIDIGPTTEGRRQLLAVLSSEANLARLARYQAIARSLAYGRHDNGTAVKTAEARALASEGKAIVWVDFGLHSTEVANAQAAPLLAWQLASSDTPEARAIRDRLLVVLVPDMNPDGTTLVATWYREHAGRPWALRPPELFHRYAGHDNNRDWFMFTQQETRNAAQALYHEFLPQIVFDHHQSPPYPARMFVPPYAGPTNEHIPAGVLRGIETFGRAIHDRFAREGKTGAISRIGFDAWWNGGMRTAPFFHNMIGLLAETAHASPVPAIEDPGNFPLRFDNDHPTLEPSSNYPRPYPGGRWTMRDSCDYMVSASLAVLAAAADRRESLLSDMFGLGQDAVRMGARETYVVPEGQWDPGTADRLIEVLQRGGIRVHRATRQLAVRGRQYDPGSYVIFGAQPFLPYLRDLLTPQRYPARELGPLVASSTYDITGWTLPLQMGVRVEKLAAALPESSVVEVREPPTRQGLVVGEGRAAYVLDPRANSAFTAVNRLWKGGAVVHRALAPVAGLPPGAFVVDAGTVSRRNIESVVSTLALTARAEDTLAVHTVPLRQPRIGIYAAWGGNVDEGWTRWVLDQFEFPYTRLRDADVRAGQLRRAFDVIVLPHATSSEMLNGVAPGSLPPTMTRGMTADGILQLRRFVEEGGVLIAHDAATELALTNFSLGLEDAVSGRGTRPRVPGAIVSLDVNTTHPLGWGLPKQTAAFVANARGFRTRGSSQGGPMVTIAASYPAQPEILSGWGSGLTLLQGAPVVAEARLGLGRVVLLGVRTQHRGQAYGTFKFLFNALLLPPT